MSLTKEYIDDLAEDISKKYDIDWCLVMDIFAYFEFDVDAVDSTCKRMNRIKTMLMESSSGRGDKTDGTEG